MNLELDYLVKYIGGSKLYGLDTKDSDIDWRGIFISTEPRFILGLDKEESFTKVSNEIDYSYYEIRHFLGLLSKSNTQQIECLFASEDSLYSWDSRYLELKTEKYKLINSKNLFSSLRGFIQTETKLANGERKGEVGGKRFNTIQKYGFSPKNFVQILRLAFVGETFFNEGFYPVNFKKYNEKVWKKLYEIKTEPEKWTVEKLNTESQEAEQRLIKAYEKTKFNYTFNREYANDFLVRTYKPYL